MRYADALERGSGTVGLSPTKTPPFHPSLVSAVVVVAVVVFVEVFHELPAVVTRATGEHLRSEPVLYDDRGSVKKRGRVVAQGSFRGECANQHLIAQTITAVVVDAELRPVHTRHTCNTIACGDDRSVAHRHG